MEEDARRFTGEKWEVINLPLSWINAVVKAFLAGGHAQWKHLFEQGRPGAPLSGQRSRFPITDCSTTLDACSSGPRSHASVHERRPWCGQSRGQPRKRARKLQNPWQVGVARGDPRKATAVPVPVMRPVAAKRPLARGECHLSHSGAGLQPGAYSGFALPTIATGWTAGRYHRAAPGAHGVSSVDCDHCRTARWPDAVSSSRGHGDEERRKPRTTSTKSTTVPLQCWRREGWPLPMLQASRSSNLPDMRRTESPPSWREKRHQDGLYRLGGFGYDLVVRVCGRSCPTACHAIETSPCPSPCLCGKAHGQDEDEMAPPQMVPQSCSLHCGTGGRGLAPWSALHEASHLPALLHLAVSKWFSAGTTISATATAPPPPVDHEKFTILHSNVRGFISRVAELSARLLLMERKPSVLCRTETWADKGLPTMRKMRATLLYPGMTVQTADWEAEWLFALERLAHRVTLLENSLVAERSWVILHTSAAAKWITDTILRSASSCIPLTTLRCRKSSQAWLDDRSVALVDANRAAEGTPLHASQSRVRHGDGKERASQDTVQQDT